MVPPGHGGEGQNHDVYIELAGPSVVDVHHNFVQRWNEASERLALDGRWGQGSEIDLAFPSCVPERRGGTIVQIQRTVHRHRYADGRSTPEGLPFDIASGERSIFEQCCSAISAARLSIYIENHTVNVPEIIAYLYEALQRGVEVVLLMPAEVDLYDNLATSPKRLALIKKWEALNEYDNFTLAGIAGLGMDGRRKPVYVHSKLMLVDDVWATVRSCNLHRFSLFGNSEMNAAIGDPAAVHGFRSALLQEHLNLDTSQFESRTALQRFRKIAIENRRNFESGDHTWEGLAFTL
jgi:cardiolipin synthase A/B